MDTNDYSLKTPIWDSLPASISWTIHHRNASNFSISEERFQGINEGINYQIILGCAAMVEGYLEQTANNLIETEKSANANSAVFLSLLNNLEVKLAKATFSDYSDVYSNFLNDGLKVHFQVINPELWKSISKLFKLRNILAHGQALSLIINYSKGTPTAAHVEFLGKFNDLLKFYKEKKLHPNQLPEDTSFKKMFLSNDIADFFFSESEKFIREMEALLSRQGYRTNSNINSIFKKYWR